MKTTYDYFVTGWNSEGKKELGYSVHKTDAAARAKISWHWRRAFPEIIFKVVKFARVDSCEILDSAS
jgi:hypothetical protein